MVYRNYYLVSVGNLFEIVVYDVDRTWGRFKDKTNNLF